MNSIIKLMIMNALTGFLNSRIHVVYSNNEAGIGS